MIYLDINKNYRENLKRQQQQQQQGRQNNSPMQGYSYYQKFAGQGQGQNSGPSWWDNTKDWISSLFDSSGSSGGSSGSAEGGAGTAAWVLAAILGQMAATNSTGTKVEGQPTGNWFTVQNGRWDPSTTTEPWLAMGHDWLGWKPTAGEKFDAAVKNSDWGNAVKRLPAAADYWADPIRSWAGFSTWRNIVGDDIASLIDPIGGLFNKIAEWL